MTKITTVKEDDSVTIIEIVGRVNSELEFDLAEKLEECLSEKSVLKIIINLEKVDFINSSALGILLNAHKEIEKSHGRLALSAPSPEVSSLLEITHLNSIFEIFKYREDALEAFKE